MKIHEFEKIVSKKEKEISNKVEFISDFLFKNPEIGKEEYISSKFLSDRIKEYGFSVKFPFCNMETAFFAELDNGDGPTIAFVTEYDALPGVGPNGELAHACGHNWMSAATMGACMVLASMKQYFRGKILLIGTPAVENYGSKVNMIKEHVFDDVDVVIQPHLDQYTNISCKTLAMDAIEFTFRGKGTHSSEYPEEGINALDSLQLFFIGINALRPHFRSDVKIHGIVCEGGEAPGIIPEKATCKYYIRASDRVYLNRIRKKIIRCAEGAALMIGTEMKYCYFENSYDNLINIPALQEIATQYLEQENIKISAMQDINISYASSDIGNVSHVCPTLYMEFDVEPDDVFRLHDETALRYVNSQFSYKRLHQVIRAMVGISLELYGDEKKIEDVKKRHREILNCQR